jgi:ribosomal protein S18 acetylase RimI-like enzyme
MDKKLSEFIQTVIKDSPYYSRWAKKDESKRFSSQSLRKELKKKDNLYLTTRTNGKIIGAVNGCYEAGTFWIDWLVVDEKNRRNGIGQGLMKRLENRLKREGVHKIWRDSRTSNKESKSLLTKLGYKRITTIKKHWYKQDFILWQKFL